jgi:hypothetical protein
MASCLAAIPMSAPSFFRSSAAVEGQAIPSTSACSFAQLERSRSVELNLRSSWLGSGRTSLLRGKSRSATRHHHRSSIVALFGGHVKVSEIRSPGDLLDQAVHVVEDIGNSAKKMFEGAAAGSAVDTYPANGDAELSNTLQDIGTRFASILHQPLNDESSNLSSPIAIAGRAAIAEISSIAASLPSLDLPHLTLPQTAALTALGVLVCTASLSSVYDRNKDVGLPKRYNPKAIADYFERRPLDVTLRSASILAQVSVLAGAVLLDQQTGKKELNEPLRARQCRELITKLGPTAIKGTTFFLEV